MSSKVLLVSHVYSTSSGPVYGPIDVVENYLVEKKIKHQVIKYPLTSILPLPIKSFSETLTTLFKTILYKVDIFIGIDPLNAFAGVILRKIGFLKKTVFYCVDYTPTRFENKLINSIYLWIDRFAATNSDEVWNVSSRIVDLRKAQGISFSKIKLVPNSPSFGKCPRQNAGKIDRNKIVMVSGLTHSRSLDLVLSVFKKVHSKFPRVKLTIIGTGGYQNKLKARINSLGIDKSVLLVGQLSNAKLLMEVSKSILALSIYSYSKEYSWVYYGDSKKTREYLACGTPVIITDAVATSIDIKKYNAGVVIKLNEKELLNAIEKFLMDRKFWINTRKNAIVLAKEFDINPILDRTLLPLV